MDIVFFSNKQCLLYFLTLSCYLTTLTHVHGDYQVEVHMLNYSPGQSGLYFLCGRSGRCDRGFTFCVKRIGSNIRRCNFPRTSDDNFNDAPIDFSQPTFLGLPNPLRLDGLTTSWQGTQISIGVYDYLAIDIPSSVTIGTTQNYLLQQDNYHGDRCDSFNECTAGTHNCANGAACVDSSDGFSCNCLPGYTGTRCETEVNECLLMETECSGRGTCTDGFNLFTCACDTGFSGLTCETNIDDCVGVNCSGNGRCVDGVNSYSCECDTGFSGLTCETNIDDCVGVNCSGNGRCVDAVNTYSCDCHPGYTGQYCGTDINECSLMNEDCSGHGDCIDRINLFTCVCDAGFSGLLCDTNIDDCVGVNCSGNGRCVDGVNNFTCVCQSGFTGDLCGTVTRAATIFSSPAFKGGLAGVILLLAVILTFIGVLGIVVVAKRRSHDQQRTTTRDSDDIQVSANITYGVFKESGKAPTVINDKHTELSSDYYEMVNKGNQEDILYEEIEGQDVRYKRPNCKRAEPVQNEEIYANEGLGVSTSEIYETV